MGMRAIIFDLDGVIVDTVEFHFKAWKQVADAEGIYFDQKINERLKGVSRMESLNVIMEKKGRLYTQSELEELAFRKNAIYQKMLSTLCPADILAGIKVLLESLKAQDVKLAICSASKNTEYIVEKLKISNCFDVIVTGNDTVCSKPDPEGFLLASKRLGVKSKNCIVIEDAAAGIEAACSAGMKSVGIGDKAELNRANLICQATEYLVLDDIMSLF